MTIEILPENIPDQIYDDISELYGRIPLLELKKQKVIPRVGEYVWFFDCRELAALKEVKFRDIRNFVKETESLNYLKKLLCFIGGGHELLVTKVSYCYDETLYNDNTTKIKARVCISVDCAEFLSRVSNNI